MRAKHGATPQPLWPGAERGLAAGWFAAFPALAAYEAALQVLPSGGRNPAEAALFLWTLPLGGAAPWVRPLLVGLGLGAAALALRLRGVRAWRVLATSIVEGLGAALLIGPLLVLAMQLLDVGAPDLSWDPAGQVPRPAAVGLALGAGVWEELVFRVGVIGLLLYALLLPAGGRARASRAWRWSAECLALAGSAVLFAGFHFERYAGWLHEGGLAFDGGRFTYFVLAGILLGILVRWRGLGAAVWAHGLFNTALLLGLDPDLVR